MRTFELPDILPNIAVKEGLFRGRSPRDGYQRGWGIQFGKLREAVMTEPLFLKATTNLGVPFLVSDDKRMNMYLLLTRFLPKLKCQDVIEFGSYKGGNALFMAVVLREIAPEAKVYALDTFEGMPTTDSSIDAHQKGNFSDASLSDLTACIDKLDLTNLIPVQGLFQQTFPKMKDQKFGMAHIDADIYSAVKYAQDAVWPQMIEGGYVVYDDAEISSCIGATQAVEELIMEKRIHCEQIWPHFVFRANL